MLISVVLVVEARARRIGIHNAYLDHDVLPDLTFAGLPPTLIQTLRQFYGSRNSEDAFAIAPALRNLG